MKNLGIFIFLLTILSIGLVSSVEISLKDSVQKGENFVVKVSGNFVKPLTKDNIHFYRRHLPTEMGQFDLVKIEGDYYFYLFVPLDKLADNYSVVLEGIEYKIGTTTKKDDVSKNFTIENETVPFTVSPPLIIAHEKYNVSLQNLKETSIEISLEKTDKIIEEIPAGESVESGGFLDSLFSLFSKEETNTTNVSETIEEVPTVSTSMISLKSGETKTLEYLAPEKKGFQMLEFYYEDSVYGSLIYNPEDRVEEIVSEDLSEINETINETNETIIYETNITNETIVTVNGTNITVINTTSCETANLSKCIVDKERCSGEIKYTDTEACCAGDCVQIEKSNTGKIIGWSIIIVLALFLTWFLKKKYRGANPGKINLFNIAKGKD